MHYPSLLLMCFTACTCVLTSHTDKCYYYYIEDSDVDEEEATDEEETPENTSMVCGFQINVEFSEDKTCQ